MMRLEIQSADGGTRAAEGTNIIPAFPAGTELIGYSINGKRFNSTEPVVADGRDSIILLAQIRRAIECGAPPLWRPKRGRSVV